MKKEGRTVLSVLALLCLFICLIYFAVRYYVPHEDLQQSIESEVPPALPIEEVPIEENPIVLPDDEPEIPPEEEPVIEEPVAEPEEPDPEAEPVSEPEPELPTVDFAEWQAVNPDIYAWITVPGTQVDYPIVQRDGNDGYYLRRDLNGEYSVGGTLFTESSYNSKSFEEPVTVIYGHSMRNGTMFGSLQAYAKSLSFEENPVFTITTPEKVLTYRLVGGVPYSEEHILYYHNFEDKKEFTNFFSSLYSSRSLHANLDREQIPQFGDKVVILSTCLLSDSKKRYLIIGVLDTD